MSKSETSVIYTLAFIKNLKGMCLKCKTTPSYAISEKINNGSDIKLPETISLQSVLFSTSRHTFADDFLAAMVIAIPSLVRSNFPDAENHCLWT